MKAATTLKRLSVWITGSYTYQNLLSLLILVTYCLFPFCLFFRISIPRLIDIVNLFQHLVTIGKMIKMPLAFNKVEPDIFGGMG